MQDIYLSTKLVFVRIAFILATIIGKIVIKIVTSFLLAWNKNLHNNFSYYSYSI